MTESESDRTDPWERMPANTQITVCPNGPLLVRGDFSVVDMDGMPVARTRRTVALCRCGQSASKPWCDGSHKTAGFTAP